MTTLYCIEHNRTKNLLPIEFQTGGSYWEGEGGKVPRLFTSRRNAANFISHWVKGEAHNVYDTVSDGFLDYEEKVGLEYKDKGRKREDLTIIEAELILYPSWAEPGSLTHSFRRLK